MAGKRKVGQGSTSGGSTSGGWDESKHPRHPAGSSQGGEWAKVEAWWKQTKPYAPMPSGPAQEMHALTAYRKAKHLRTHEQRYGKPASYRDLSKLATGKTKPIASGPRKYDKEHAAAVRSGSLMPKSLKGSKLALAKEIYKDFVSYSQGYRPRKRK